MRDKVFSAWGFQLPPAAAKLDHRVLDFWQVLQGLQKDMNIHELLYLAIDGLLCSAIDELLCLAMGFFIGACP